MDRRMASRGAMFAALCFLLGYCSSSATNDAGDAEADIDVPAECTCAAPLGELDERLMAIEDRVARLDALAPAGTLPESFSFQVANDSGTAHGMAATPSWISADRRPQFYDASGTMTYVVVLSMTAYDQVERRMVEFELALPETGIVGSHALGPTVLTSWRDTNFASGGAPTGCTGGPGLYTTPPTGTMVVSAYGERIVGTFEGSFGGTTGGGGPCQRVITAGRFDARVLDLPDPGEYAP